MKDRTFQMVKFNFQPTSTERVHQLFISKTDALAVLHQSSIFLDYPQISTSTRKE